MSVLNVENPVVPIESLTDEEIRRLQQSFLTLESTVPALFCGLNVAQYRAFKAMYTPDSKTGLIPAMGIVTFANGVGKTHALVLDMIGWTMGPDHLNWKAFPEEAVDYWSSYNVAKLRDTGKLSLRLVCISDDMKADGSVLMILKSLFPMAKPTAADNSKCFREIEVAHPTKTFIKNTIAVKTFDQDEIKHSGSTCNRIWGNEPLPDNIVGETIGRIRSKKGMPTGSIAVWGTLLSHSKFVSDIQDDEDLRVVQIRGHIYENCIGEDVTDEMASEVYKKIGIHLEKNSEGKGYITNGVLEISQIKAMIALWKKVCPHQLEARMSGDPLSEGGRIYLNYNSTFHKVPRSTYLNLPKNWPIIQVTDPHSARPAFTIWATVTPSNRVIILDEWPTVKEFGFYDKINYRPYTVPQECELWRKFEGESGFSENISTRIGDPNRFLDPQPYNNLTLKQMYAKEGYDFLINVNDNLVTGHEYVSEALYCDTLRLQINPNDLAAMPTLLVCDSCENVDRAMMNYGFKIERRDNKVKEVPIETFKDPCDCVRYLIVWLKTHTFEDLKVGGRKMSDYDLVKRGRMPGKGSDFFDEVNLKGRMLVGEKPKMKASFCYKGY